MDEVCSYDGGGRSERGFRQDREQGYNPGQPLLEEAVSCLAGNDALLCNLDGPQIMLSFQEFFKVYEDKSDGAGKQRSQCHITMKCSTCDLLKRSSGQSVVQN